MSKRVLYLFLALVALTFVSCTPPTQPTVPQGNQTQTQVVNVVVGGPGGANPSPSPGSSVIARVGIGVFGEGNCDAGKVIAGAERDNDLRAGCVANITCSPFDEHGVELFTGIPAAPTRFVAISGEGTSVRSSAPSNPYNLDVRGLAAGTAVFECEVGGVSSNAAPSGPFRLTVAS